MTWKGKYAKINNCLESADICDFAITCHFNYVIDRPIGYWVEFSPMVRETGVHSQAESYQRLKKWYLISPGLTLSIMRYVSRVKWSNPRKGVVPFLQLGVVAIKKGVLGSPSTRVANLIM